MVRLTRVTAAVALVAGVVWLATFGSFEQQVHLSVERNTPLPELRLPLLDRGLLEGDTTFVDSAADLDGKVALIAFWATWCAPCIAEMPSLLALQEDFAEEGLVVLGVLHRDGARSALQWLTANERLAFRTAVGDPPFARANRVGGLPHTMLVDQDGVVRELFLGYWPERDAYLRARVKELLAAE